MTIGIVRTNWAGTSGGPGLTQFAIAANPAGEWLASEAQSAVNAVRTFWDAIKANLPDELSLSVDPVVDQYDEVTGDLVASVSAATPPTIVAGTATTGYAAGAGMKLQWETGVIRNGRRVRGATYIVPASNGVYTTLGTVNSTVRTSVNSAALTMRGSLQSADLFLNVWSRPVFTGTGAQRVRTRDGARAQVIAEAVSEKTAFQRGRRD